MVDQLRRDSVGFHGNEIATPHLDHLASEGTAFAQAYCVNPMCGPARAALLTGRFNHALKDSTGKTYFYNDRLLNTEEVSIAKAFRDSGYDCSYVGKWHNDDRGPCTHIERGPRRMGFDDYWAGINAGSPRTRPFYFSDDGQCIKIGKKWEADLHADLTIRHLEQLAKSDRPFMTFLSLLPPHDPYDLPEERKHLFDDARKQINKLRPNVPERLKDEALNDYVQYHANVLGVDDIVGRLMRKLDALKLKENTIIVFTSDHGDTLFSHGLKGKNQFYEESAAIPLIIRWPEHIKSDQIFTDFLNITDIAPTLLDLCGITPPDRMQGKSFAKRLTGIDSKGPHDSAYLEVNHPWWDYQFGQGPQGNRRCIITDKWKLVLMESKLGPGAVIPWQLFERQKDPYEMNNLANDPGCHPIINDLVKKMWRWMQETGDPFYKTSRSGIEGTSMDNFHVV